jgi:hypothetical protein
VIIQTTTGYELQDEIELETTTVAASTSSFVEYKAQNDAFVDTDIANLPSPTIRASFVEHGMEKQVLSEIPSDTVIVNVEKFNLHLGQDVPSKSIRFHCNASFPVEWIYEGYGVGLKKIKQSLNENVMNMLYVLSGTISCNFKVISSNI